MRTLAITQNITLDGRVEMLGDWFDPTLEAPEMNAEVMRQSEAEEVILLGRQTFEDFRSFWPQQTDDRTGITAHLNRVHKAVVSQTLSDPGWDNSSVLGADWRDRVAAMKQEGGGDIVTTGSVTLCPALLEAGLVDEMRLFVFPVVQGAGRTMFPDGWDARLERLDSRPFEHGVVMNTYAVRP
jgi:dihydrofolate reductase